MAGVTSTFHGMTSAEKALLLTPGSLSANARASSSVELVGLHARRAGEFEQLAHQFGEIIHGGIRRGQAEIGTAAAPVSRPPVGERFADFHRAVRRGGLQCQPAQHDQSGGADERAEDDEDFEAVLHGLSDCLQSLRVSSYFQDNRPPKCRAGFSQLTPGAAHP